MALESLVSQLLVSPTVFSHRNGAWEELLGQPEIMRPQSRQYVWDKLRHRVAQTHLSAPTVLPQHAFPMTETLSVRAGISLPVKGDGLQGGSQDPNRLSSP